MDMLSALDCPMDIDENRTYKMERDENCRKMYAIKTAKIGRWVHHPSIKEVYKSPDGCHITAVPDDLQIPQFLAQYDAVAKQNFKATTSEEEPLQQTNRVIWYYGLDKKHSFSRFFMPVRHNLLLMAFAMASNFDEEYCEPGCKDFVTHFFWAWAEALVDGRDQEKNYFHRREEFLALWAKSKFSLFHIGTKRQLLLRDAVGSILQQKDNSPQSSCDPGVFIDGLKNGKYTKDNLMEYGPQLAVRWLSEFSAGGRHQQAEIDEAVGQERDEVMEDVPDINDIPWESQTLQLLEAPPYIPTEEDVANSKINNRIPWMNPDIIFRKIFPYPKKNKENVAGLGVDFLTKMMDNTSL